MATKICAFRWIDYKETIMVPQVCMLEEGHKGKHKASDNSTRPAASDERR